MKSFKEYIKEQEQLDEVLITFGKKAYPKFNNVVILAGGTASGKGFVTKKLLGIEGKVFDVDALKKLSIATTVFAAKIKAETGVDIKKMNMSDPKDVSILHDILSDLYVIDKKVRNTMLKAIFLSDKKRKPNLIFDVTLKDMGKVKVLSDLLVEAGYEKINIHIVWIVNSLDLALIQNKDPKRERVVAKEIVVATHEGAALTMKKLIDMGSKIKAYMNGDIWFAFNKVHVDTELVVSKNDRVKITNRIVRDQEKKIGEYLEKANIFKIKAQGKTSISAKNLDKAILNKIIKYTPGINTWGKKK